MPYYMYVSLQDDDKIAVFTMDAGSGKLMPQGEVPVAGGPSPGEWPPLRQATSARTGSGMGVAGAAATSCSKLSHCCASQPLQS